MKFEVSQALCITIIAPQGPSIKYVTLFLTNFDNPLSHKVRHISEHPPLKIAWLQYALLNFVRSALISIESQLYCIVL